MHQPPSDHEHQQKYATAISQARDQGMATFHSWFNASTAVEESITRGYWDFAIHMLTPTVCSLLERPEEKAALEIGYGGGRLLNAACSYFQHVTGIDIHHDQATVETFLQAQGKRNYRLLHTTGRTIGVETGSIDFVYSFIVLQHLPTYDVFVSYVKETYRCLRPGGVAQLYFGRYFKFKPNIPDIMRYLLRGHKEIPQAPVNHTSLVVSGWKAKQLCKATGFRVVATGYSYKRVPDGYPHLPGGQNVVTLIKPK